MKDGHRTAEYENLVEANRLLLLERIADALTMSALMQRAVDGQWDCDEISGEDQKRAINKCAKPLIGWDK